MRRLVQLAIASMVLSACVAVPESEPLLFAVDDDRLHDRHGEAEIEAAVRALLDDPQLHLSIVGHADEDNTDDYNRELSRRRAEHVRARLLERAPELAERITIEARGEWDASERSPSPDDEQAKARNRRVELHFHYPRSCQPSFDLDFVRCEWSRLPPPTEPEAPPAPVEAPVEPQPDPQPQPAPRAQQSFRGPYLFGLGGYAIASSEYLRQFARWGLGAGYLWGFEHEFRIALGLTFDHLVDVGFVFPQSGPCAPFCANLDRSSIRVVPELRIGGTRGGLWGWIRLSAGLVVQHHEATLSMVVNEDPVEVAPARWDPGVVFGIGPGVAITLTRHLFVLLDATVTYARLPGIDGGGGGTGIYDVGLGLGWVF